ncbi:potassium channel family protein [uncultured Sulfitobacter sp.]|uniref:potassium channel family protein n=1 Tax=uncultured Sulfitobacter sp. TaxID=191468 RepID=UPI0030FC7AA7
MNIPDSKFTKYVVLAIFLFSIANYGRIAADFSQGNVWLPIDLLTLVATSIVTFLLVRSGMECISQEEARGSIVAFLGVIVGVSVPLGFATAYLIFHQHFECISGDPTSLDILYFSFVTFTTLGYGDFSPVGVCKGFAALEAIVGYLSLGIFAALLVTYLARNQGTK